jgi:hypothetical protein
MTAKSELIKQQKQRTHIWTYFLLADAIPFIILFIIIPTKRFLIGALLIFIFAIIMEQIWFERHIKSHNINHQMIKKRILVIVIIFIIWLITLLTAVFALNI